MSYTFTVCEEDKMAGTSWICGLYDMFDSWNQLLENEAKALGQLKTRFGEPMRTSNDMENLFEYCITATDPEGNELILTAYHGPSGPAIGGAENDLVYKIAARQLANYVQSAELTDYKISGIYHDAPIPLKVTLGVKKGEPYAKFGIAIGALLKEIKSYLIMLRYSLKGV